MSIVKNYKNKADTASGNFNFEAFLNQKEVRLFATLIADEYVKNVQQLAAFLADRQLENITAGNIGFGVIGA